MTTIAFRNGIMASDSLGIVNNTTKLPGAFQKIWRLRDGSLVGAAGDSHRVIIAIMGAGGALEIKALSEYDSSEILCVRPDSTMLLYQRGTCADLGRPEFYAIGSGVTAALGALNSGASAEDAIRAAAAVDIFTDNRVQTLEFGGPEFVPIIPPSSNIPASGERPIHFWGKVRSLFRG